MGEKLTYFDFAENDYQYLKCDFAEKRVSNLLCYSAQSICERYLKHIIDQYTPENINATTVLKAHSLKALGNFIEDNIPNFQCDWNTILLADGYYFSARYPGDDAIIAKQRDADNCSAAVEEARAAVLEFEKSPKINKEEHSSDVTIDNEKAVLDAIFEFDQAPEVFHQNLPSPTLDKLIKDASHEPSKNASHKSEKKSREETER